MEMTRTKRLFVAWSRGSLIALLCLAKTALAQLPDHYALKNQPGPQHYFLRVYHKLKKPGMSGAARLAPQYVYCGAAISAEHVCDQKKYCRLGVHCEVVACHNESRDLCLLRLKGGSHYGIH